MSTSVTLHVTSEVHGLHAQLASGLLEAAIWSRYAAAAAPHFASVAPRRTPMMFGDDRPEVLEIVRGRFAADAHRSAFVRMMAHWEVFLLGLTVLAELVNAVDGRSHLTSEQVEWARRQARRTVQNSGADVLVRQLATLPDRALADGVSWFSDLYRVRNCVVHRAAHVAPEDTRGTDELRVRWARVFVQRTGTGQREPLTLGAVLQGGDALVLAFHEREWREGDEIVLDDQELQEIARALTDLGARICNHLHSRFEKQLPETPPIA